MKTITNGVYTYFYSIGPSQEEIELTNSVLKNSNFSDKKELSEKILKLPFNEQVHVIHYILSEMYKLEYQLPDDGNKKIEKFLALQVFNDHRALISAIVNDEDEDDENLKKERLSEFENKFNIKIIIEKE